MILTKVLAFLMTQTTLNLVFAALCLAASRGSCAKRTFQLSALLYIALAFCPTGETTWTERGQEADAAGVEVELE